MRCTRTSGVAVRKMPRNATPAAFPMAAAVSRSVSIRKAASSIAECPCAITLRARSNISP
jgi:hypothetical protein